MLLLRLVLATALLIQAGYYLSEPDGTLAAWFAGSVGIVLGILLFIGFLTPIAGVIVGVCAAAVGFSLIPACSKTLFDSSVSVIFAVTILTAVIVLGPGEFSLDARVFGRREIIIPPSTSPRP